MSLAPTSRDASAALALAALVTFAAAQPASTASAPTAPDAPAAAAPRLACSTPPVYPVAAVRGFADGESTVHVLAAPDGSVVDVRLLRPSGVGRENVLLDDAAVEAARHCRVVRDATAPAPAGNEWVVGTFSWRIEGVDRPMWDQPFQSIAERANQGEAGYAYWAYLRSSVTSEAEIVAARHWLEFAAEHGMVRARSELARLYAVGEGGLAPDPVKAEAMWAPLAAQHDQQSLFALAHLLMESTGPARDPARAIELLTRAAKDDHAYAAMLLLGDTYAAGTAVPRDDQAAVDWWRRAALEHSPTAYLRLGDAWAKGFGVHPDRTLAATYYLMAENPAHVAGAQARLDAMGLDADTLAAARKKAQDWESGNRTSLP